MINQIIFKIATIFFGIVIGIFLLEIFLRLFPNITNVYATVNDSSPRIYIEDEKRGYALLPEAVSRHYSLHGDFKVVYRINSQGLRSLKNNYGEKKCKRILLLGDSFIFGLGVRDNETLASRLEEALNNRGSKVDDKNSNKFEVINTGVAGYTLDNEYMTLKFFAELKPDIVLLGLCSNDIYDLSFHKWVMDEKGDIVKVSETVRHIDNRNRFVNGPKSLYSKLDTVDNIREFYRKYLFIYNFLGTLQYRNRESAEIRQEDFLSNKDTQIENVMRSLKVLLLIKRLCRDVRAKFVIFSTNNEVLARYPKINSDALGIPIFDISELRSFGKKLNFTHDGHWSPTGTIIVANWLSNYLIKNKIIEE